LALNEFELMKNLIYDAAHSTLGKSGEREQRVSRRVGDREVGGLNALNRSEHKCRCRPQKVSKKKGG